MKVLKTAAVLAALTMASSAFAEVKVNAFNKLKTDVVILDNNGEETTTMYPGFENQIKAEILSDHVDIMVDGRIQFFDFTQENDVGLQWKGDVKDWYIEARILDDLLTLGYHDNIDPNGSYLPIWDDNVEAGNIGSNGFTLVVRPIDGLRLSCSLPFTSKDINWLKVDGVEKDGLPETKKNPDIRLGAIYDMGIAEFGVAAHDILDSDERRFGFYLYSAGLFGQVKGLNLRAGFAHGEAATTAGVVDFDNVPAGVIVFGGKNLWNVAFEFVDILPVGLTLEAAGNTDKEDSFYDIYAAAKVDIGINEKLSLSVSGKVLLDNGNVEPFDALDTGIGAKVALDVAVTDKDKIEVAVDYFKVDDAWLAKFPCYWKHTF